MKTVPKCLLGRAKYSQAQCWALVVRETNPSSQFLQRINETIPFYQKKKSKEEEESGCIWSYQWRRTSRSLHPTIWMPNGTPVLISPSAASSTLPSQALLAASSSSVSLLPLLFFYSSSYSFIILVSCKILDFCFRAFSWQTNGTYPSICVKGRGD